MNKASLRQYVQYLLTLGLAIYLANKWASGKLSYYINARFFPLTLFAIGVLSLMAASGWLQSYKDLMPPSESEPNKLDVHITQALSICLLLVLLALFNQQPLAILSAFALAGLLGWLLLPQHSGGAKSWNLAADLPLASLLIFSLPIIIGLAAPEQPLNSSSLNTRGVSLNASMSISQNSSDTLTFQQDDRTILDWVKLFNYESDPSIYIGEDVNVIGFVYHDPRLPEGEFMVSRFIITCCVADAFALGMPVDWQQNTLFEDNTWINVQGTLDEMQIGDQTVPMVHATSIQTMAAPEQPYLYP
jgi:putative membrane protein